MKLRYILAVPILALFGGGCDMSVPLPTPPSPTEGAAVCPETPQVHYFNKLAFSARELSDIQTNVVTPLVAYYEGLPDYKVVSIMIKRTDTGITVEAIIDQPDSIDPVYEGFVHERSGGGYPMWYPIEVPPGYRG